MNSGVAWLLAGGSVLALVGAPAEPPAQRDNTVHRAFAAYERGDREAIPHLLRTARGIQLNREVDAAVRQWSHLSTGSGQRRLHATFLLELALARFDMFDAARKFVTSRPDPPGTNADEDQFELAWHKTAVAFLQNQRRPDILEQRGTAPLTSRISPSAGPARPPRMVDPWVALALGITEEQWMDNEPWNLDSLGRSATARGRAAAQHFEQAASSAGVQNEALVRLSRVYVHLGRPADAVAALDRFDDSIDDRTLRYWARLFRGRALEALDQPDAAARVYAEALAMVPRSQAPATALAALERRRGNAAEAERWAATARRDSDPSTDPWRLYATGEYRLFTERLQALRRMARP